MLVREGMGEDDAEAVEMDGHEEELVNEERVRESDAVREKETPPDGEVEVQALPDMERDAHADGDCARVLANRIRSTRKRECSGTLHVANVDLLRASLDELFLPAPAPAPASLADATEEVIISHQEELASLHFLPHEFA